MQHHSFFAGLDFKGYHTVNTSAIIMWIKLVAFKTMIHGGAAQLSLETSNERRKMGETREFDMRRWNSAFSFVTVIFRCYMSE